MHLNSSPEPRSNEAEPKLWIVVLARFLHATLETALERGVCIPERNGAGQRARTRPHRMTIVAAVHDPLAIFLANDFSDVVTPHHDGANGRTARVGAVMRP